DLNIPLDKISIVVNRYDPNNSLRIEDLKSIVNHEKVYKIANDFQLVSNSSNMGVPLCETSANSKIAHDLKELARYLGKVVFDGRKRNLLSRLRAFFS
ncbi:MAG: hypothetical protein WCP96_18530, partial [Methylococcaceae bacterium]